MMFIRHRHKVELYELGRRIVAKISSFYVHKTTASYFDMVADDPTVVQSRHSSRRTTKGRCPRHLRLLVPAQEDKVLRGRDSLHGFAWTGVDWSDGRRVLGKTWLQPRHRRRSDALVTSSGGRRACRTTRVSYDPGEEVSDR